MKRRFVIGCLLGVMMVCCIGMMAACAPAQNWVLGDGGTVPSEIFAEFCTYCKLPDVKISGTDGSEVETTVVDSKNNLVQTINNRFRATDLGGYTIQYKAKESDLQDIRISVVVKKTVPPSVRVDMPNGLVILKDNPFDIPECTVIDASDPELRAMVTVTMNGKPVPVTGNQFTPREIGEYCIEYKATDSFGNSGIKTLTVCCENADILNPFEGEENLTSILTGNPSDAIDHSFDHENAFSGNGLQVNVTATARNWATIYVPLKNADGVDLTWNQLKKYEKLQVYIYASEDNEFGLSTKVFPIKKGKNIMVFDMQDVIASYNQSELTYRPGIGFYLNLKFVNEGASFVIDQFMGVRARNYVEEPDPIVITQKNGAELPETYQVFLGDEFIVPEVKAERGDAVLDVVVTIKDSKGESVEATTGSFPVEDKDGYILIFTAQDSIGSCTEEVSIVVDMSQAYRIAIDGYDGMLAEYNQRFSIPNCVAKDVFGTELETEVEVTVGANADPVNVENGSFLADRLNEEYTISYVIQSGDYSGKYESITVLCKKAHLLNGFTTVDDVSTAFNSTKEVVSNGVKVTANAAANWATMRFPLKKDGAFISWENLQKFDKIYVSVFVSDVAIDSIGILPAASYVKVKQGWNIIEFTMADIVAAYNGQGTVKQYEENVRGLYLGLRKSIVGQHLIFGRIYGIYADDYEEETSSEVVLNRFDAENSIGLTNHWSKSIVSEGIQITATAIANWMTIRLPLQMNEEYVSWEKLQEFDRIVIRVYVSHAGFISLGLLKADTYVPVEVGWNDISFRMSDIVAQYEQATTVSMYEPNAKGLYLGIRSSVLNEYLIFSTVTGVYAE